MIFVVVRTFPILFAQQWLNAICLVSFLFLSGPLLSGKEIFRESRGFVVIEAESTSSRLGKWKEKTDVKDYRGACHLEFTGNQIMNGSPKSPLIYEFEVKKGGKYTLVLRARKRLETERDDLSNDCYVSLKGDFEPGGEASKKILTTETKMFGGKADEWGWARKLDVDHKKFEARYLLKPGETYRLKISGRSKNFNIDQIIFYHDSHSFREVQKMKLKESKRKPTRLPRPVTMKVTTFRGVQVKVRLLELDEGQLRVEVDRKEQSIPLSSLIEADQERIKKWAEDLSE